MIYIVDIYHRYFRHFFRANPDLRYHDRGLKFEFLEYGFLFVFNSNFRLTTYRLAIVHKRHETSPTNHVTTWSVA